MITDKDLANATIDNRLIRNVSIVAHIDHGKTTIADCLMKICGANVKGDQMLDSMDIEKEKGITIKSQTVRLIYSHNCEEYIINIVDTPGHVDFSYETNRGISACNGSLLIIDASQGVEAQTVANAYQAIEMNHVIIPVLNKIDLPSADIVSVKNQIKETLLLEPDNAIPVSAKFGTGIEDILKSIIQNVPHPSGKASDLLRCLIVDSWYDNYLGIIVLIKIENGTISIDDHVSLFYGKRDFVVQSLGIFNPVKITKNSLIAGEIGYISTNIKNIGKYNVGDTVFNTANRALITPLKGFKKIKSVVFCTIFPIENEEFEKLKIALYKLNMNDSSFEFALDSAASIGHGYRCGFLGLLHLEITIERLSREYGVEIFTTAPSVTYMVFLRDGSSIEISGVTNLPDESKIDYFEEPFTKTEIITPNKYIGSVSSLCVENRAENIDMHYIDENRSAIHCTIPLSEIVTNFYDRLKSITSGHASINWEFSHYSKQSIAILDIMLNGEKLDVLSLMVHRAKAEYQGRKICLKLKDVIPRQMFKIAIQASINSKVIARETISPLRKDVTAKCYGGDVSRKRKLLEKQKKGKKKMRSIGNVQIPGDAFTKILSQ